MSISRLHVFILMLLYNMFSGGAGTSKKNLAHLFIYFSVLS